MLSFLDGHCNCTAQNLILIKRSTKWPTEKMKMRKKINVVREASPFAPPNKDLSILKRSRNGLDVLPDGTLLIQMKGKL